jgi:hypothetical protein
MSISLAIEWDDATLEALNVYPVWARAADTIPDHGYKNIEGNPQEIDGQWYQSWVLTQMTPEETQEETDQQWATVKQQQQFILNQTVIVNPDGNVALPLDSTLSSGYIGVEIEKQTYDSYITAVENVTIASNPFNISWPANPFQLNAVGISDMSGNITVSQPPDGVVPGTPIFGPRPE